MLEIAKDFQIPIDALTETFCLVGKRGVGKTHTSVVLVEEFLAQELPVCIIDVLGVWWGDYVHREMAKVRDMKSSSSVVNMETFRLSPAVA